MKRKMKTINPGKLEILATVGPMVILLFGCATEKAPEPMAEGQKYLLQEKPTGATEVLEARKLVSEAHPRVPMSIVGRIGMPGRETWDSQRAVFLVRDQSLAVDGSHDAHSEDHADNCPFCKLKAGDLMDPTVRVELVDQDGTTPAVNASKLLGLRENQLVVVTGQARIDSLGALVVAADGVYVHSL